MNNNTLYFGDKFNSPNIKPTSLYNFSSVVKTRITLGNDGGEFTSVLVILTSALTAFGTELIDIDTNLNLQKGATSVTDTIFKNFKNTMSDNERAIAKALGGDTTPAYQSFFPHMISEYSNAAKIDMTVLTSRVYDAAEANKIALGTDLTAELKAFKSQWTDALDAQQLQIGKVVGGRIARSANRIALEMALMKVLGTVTLNFCEDETKCKSFFDFALLYPVHHQEVFPYEIPHDGMVYHQHHFAADGEVEIEVENNVNLRYFLSDDAVTPKGQMQETVGAGNFKLKIATFQVDTKTHVYLLIFNLSTGETAIIKLHI